MSEHPFDSTDLDAAEQFRPYLHTGERIKVRTSYPDGEHRDRTGTVGRTTGWKPAYLLMHNKRAVGSWDVLGPRDRIIAVQVRPGGPYVPVEGA